MRTLRRESGSRRGVSAPEGSWRPRAASVERECRWHLPAREERCAGRTPAPRHAQQLRRRLVRRQANEQRAVVVFGYRSARYSFSPSCVWPACGGGGEFFQISAAHRNNSLGRKEGNLCCGLI